MILGYLAVETKERLTGWTRTRAGLIFLRRGAKRLVFGVLTLWYYAVTVIETLER